uniref:AraC family transcriptional regulator n=1 Tax=uncultured Bacillota bacterium TaxID=344338 RepID=A0A650ENL7_9FIRM|nr:AraC family transcriptional regulator [uncultured Firmicutes bacterium]
MYPQDIPLVNRHFYELNPLILGQEDCAPGHSFGPHLRSYTLVHYVKSGKGVLRNETGSYTVQAGEIFLILPGQLTTYTADKDDPWHYIWVGFDGAKTDLLKNLSGYVQPYPHDTFYHMLKAKELTNTREEFLLGQLYILLAYLTEGEHAAPGYERQAADYIRANYMRDIQIEDIARMLGLNRKYLSKLFKAFAGMSMQDFLIQTRMEHAAQYLRQGEPVAATASLSGYRDSFHFSKMFKKQFGVSPRQYQKGSVKA